MTTKTITITEDAYDRLKAMKRADESFTDLLLRLTEDEDDVMGGFGAWADTGLGAAVDEAREELDEDFETRQDALSGH